MRSLAEAVGIGTMSLYTYVPGKPELIDPISVTTRGSTEVPPGAQVLIDELVISGSAETGRDEIDLWFDAGAELPVLALPPGRPVAELDVQ